MVEAAHPGQLLPLPAHPLHQSNKPAQRPLPHTHQTAPALLQLLLPQVPHLQLPPQLAQACLPTWPALLRKLPPRTPESSAKCQRGGRGELVLTIPYSGVAVGSTMGHAISGFFGGGSSAPAEAEQSQAVQSQGSAEQSNWGARSCEVDAKQFTKCLDENQGNMQTCSWYLEQLVRSSPFPYFTMSRRDANMSCYYRRPASLLPAVTKLSIEVLKGDGLYEVV